MLVSVEDTGLLIGRRRRAQVSRPDLVWTLAEFEVSELLDLGHNSFAVRAVIRSSTEAGLDVDVSRDFVIWHRGPVVGIAAIESLDGLDRGAIAHRIALQMDQFIEAELSVDPESLNPG